MGGKALNVGLGSFPKVSLASARAEALENAQMVSGGVDPRVKLAVISTIAAAVDIVISVHAEGWRNPRVAVQWQSSIEKYALPALGHKLLSEISTADVWIVLAPILTKRETAKTACQRISAIMKWSMAHGHRTDNPAGEAITAALPKTASLCNVNAHFHLRKSGDLSREYEQATHGRQRNCASNFLRCAHAGRVKRDWRIGPKFKVISGTHATMTFSGLRFRAR